MEYGNFFPTPTSKIDLEEEFQVFTFLIIIHLKCSELTLAETTVMAAKKLLV